MPNGDSPEGPDFDVVTFPDGRQGWVPRGYGAQAQAMINRAGGGGRGGGGAGTIGTIADGFEAAQQLLGNGEMQDDLDEAADLLAQLDAERDIYAHQLDNSSTIEGGKTVGQRWKLIQQLQDRRDYLQERVLSSQIRLNYGSGLAAGGRAVGRVLGSGGDQGGGAGLSTNDLVIGGGMLGLGILLLRDRDRRDSRALPTRRTYGT